MRINYNFNKKAACGGGFIKYRNVFYKHTTQFLPHLDVLIYQTQTDYPVD